VNQLKDKKAFELTERDLLVLKFVGKGGIASLSQLNAKFWPGAKERTCYERLHKLKKSGFLKTEVTTVRNKKGELIFLITPNGSNLFSQSIKDQFFNNITTSEVKQQLLAQEAIIKLEKEWAEQGKELVNWKHERELRSEMKQKQGKFKKVTTNQPQVEVADAQATIRDNTTGEIYEVEIEVDGAYYGKMLKGKIDRFAASNKPAIWVTTPDRAEMIANRISSHPNIQLLVV
jgi:DNA-binding PadR family transcriptional regulator